MENSYLSNKVVIKCCKEYYRIINEEFNELDYMSDKIIQIYQSYIFSIDVSNKKELKKVINFDKAVIRYFDDYEFKAILTKFLTSLKVPKTCSDVLSKIVDSILEEYEKYMDGFTRNLYIPRWI